MADDFYNKEESTTEETKPEMVKVGEKEYSQDDLSKIVGLGETAQEYEVRSNRKIEQFWPDYTKKSQRLAELEKAEEVRKEVDGRRETERLAERSKEGNLSPDEAIQLAKNEAKKLGLVSQDDISTLVNQGVTQALAGQKLLEDTNSAVSTVKEQYGISTSSQDVLKFMSDHGANDNANPSTFIKIMFEEQIDKAKAAKLQGIKPEGMTTQEQTTAGSKTPSPPQKITSKEQLAERIHETLTRSGRGL